MQVLTEIKNPTINDPLFLAGGSYLDMAFKLFEHETTFFKSKFMGRQTIRWDQLFFGHPVFWICSLL